MKLIFVTVGIYLLAGIFTSGIVQAEAQFGGDVSGVVACTCGSNAGGTYFIVGDPHGNEGGGMESYVVTPSTDRRDCEPIQDGEEALGMHNENNEECKIQIGNACVLVGTGKGVDIYGTSGNCHSGLNGDASGDNKSEIITPDGRTADGGDDDDGGPSGGSSNATQNDAHLETVDGVKADGTSASHMNTSDNQNNEGTGTSHMTTSDNRDYTGSGDSVFTDSGNDNGYSPGGSGQEGQGYGSVGGSVGSGGLQSPVVLGDQNQIKEKLQKENKPRADLNIADRYNIQKTTNENILFSLFIILGGISGAGYFVFRSIKKVFSSYTQNHKS